MGYREPNLADLIKIGLNITAGNSFGGRLGVVRDEKGPQPGGMVYPAVNFGQDLGRGPDFGVPVTEFGRFDQAWVRALQPEIAFTPRGGRAEYVMLAKHGGTGTR